MFTGIVQTTGRVLELRRTDSGIALAIDHGGWKPEGGYQPVLGHSIAVSGVCLTLIGIEPDRFVFDVIPETLAVTRLGELQPGDRVNLEPAVLPTQAMGGHFVQGHVDGVGSVVAVDRQAGEWRVTIAAPTALQPFLIHKGSVTVQGVSLTLASVDDAAGQFEVALIPTTLSATTLGELAVGASVHLEADILAKTVVTALGRQQTRKRVEDRVTLETLQQAGFVETKN